jgi:multiple sugar transport system ATP-binding protein
MRLELRIEFRRLHKKLGQTVIYVTHDQVEALSLADRVAVLHEGCLQQVDRPERLYDRPVNRFVAEFIGSPPMNLVPARLGMVDGEMRLVGKGFVLHAPIGIPPSNGEKEVCIGVRPEAVRLGIHPTEDTPLAVHVRWIEHHGSRSIVHADLRGTIVKVAIPPERVVSIDSVAWLGFTPKLEALLDVESNSFLAAV